MSINDVLETYGERVVAELVDNLEFRKKNATGNLSSSIRFKVKIVGTLHIFELSMAEYWKFADKGRRPGKAPPIRAILQWMTAKRVGSYIKGKGKNKAAPGGSIIATNLQEQRSLAYLISRKIEKYGTKGSGFYTDTFKPGHAGDVEALESEIGKVYGREVKVFLQELPT